MAGRKKKSPPPGRELAPTPTMRPKTTGTGEGKTPSRRPVPAENFLPADPANPPAKIPKSYSPALMVTICEAVAGGLSLDHTLRMLGLQKVFPSWRRAAKNFIDELVARADSEFVSVNLDKIRKHTDKSWQAAAWLLERRFPSQFSQNRGKATKGDGKTGPINILIVSGVPRPTDIMRNRSRQVGERGLPLDEIEGSNEEMLEVINVEAEVRSNVPRRGLTGGEE